MDLIDIIYSDSLKKSNNKIIKRDKGQFYTPPKIAKFMSELSHVKKTHIKILDPGSGTGVLSIAICLNLSKNFIVKSIKLDVYENDNEIIKTLDYNLKQLEDMLISRNIEFEYKIYSDNFITLNASKWNQSNVQMYDIVISNPPYKKLSIGSTESVTMKSIVKGQPNIYALFVAMSLHLLKENGEMIFITPKSFCSGAYFDLFRKYLFDNADITNIHLFTNRSRTFLSEEVLQETIIYRIEKSKNVNRIVEITASVDTNFEILHRINVSHSDMLRISNDKSNFYLLKSEEEYNILRLINTFSCTFDSLNYKFRTGPVVDFRLKEYIQNSTNSDYPLLWPSHINFTGFVNFPNIDRNDQYIRHNKSYLISNVPMIIIKRFSSMDESRRLYPNIYIPLEGYSLIGVENHLNYLSSTSKKEISVEELYGIYCILNTTIYDKYYRILNGNTQVNVYELNNVPIPDIEHIRKLGKWLITSSDMSTSNCDILFSKLIQETEDDKNVR